MVSWLSNLTLKQIVYAATGIWAIKIIALWVIDVLKK